MNFGHRRYNNAHKLYALLYLVLHDIISLIPKMMLVSTSYFYPLNVILSGSRWQEKSFELECRPGGIRRLVACVTEDGQRIPVNGSKEVNGFTLVCQQFGNGTVVFHGAKSVKPESKTGYRFGRGGDDDSPSNIRNRPGAGRNTGTHSWASPQQAVKCVDENGYQRNIGKCV